MKTTKLSILALLVISGTILAQGGRRGGFNMSRMVAPMLASAADKDFSGEVTAEEWNGFVTSVIDAKTKEVNMANLRAHLSGRALDENKNGKLEVADLEKIFAAADTNKDKALSRQELSGRGGGRRGQGFNREEMMKKYDANGDGRLDQDERAKMREDMRGNRGGNNRGRRGRGEGAQGGARGQGGQGGEAGQARQQRPRLSFMDRAARTSLLMAADKNKDNEVSAEEWKGFVAGLKAKDGVLSASEVTSIVEKAAKERAKADEGKEEEEGAGGRRGRRGRRGRFDMNAMLERGLDANDDEIVDKADFDQMFSSLDADGDKKLSEAELTPQRRGRRRRDI